MAKMKNPFKLANITDTAINLAVAGGANAAVDFAMSQVSQLASLESTYKNAIKIGLGVIGGSLTSNKYLRSAVDGVATVGVSNIVSDLIAGTTSSEAAAGLKPGTIGRLRAGNRYYRGAKSRRVSGLQDGFMGC